MVKKITKYLKFVVCCALIVSLIAPTYAALSASDGSAFVTKAEFDAALADFNSRLTTFEAGINSKIDSQVTSYLDRNGIWNGKTVDLAFGGDPGKLWLYTWGLIECVTSITLNAEVPASRLRVVSTDPTDYVDQTGLTDPVTVNTTYANYYQYNDPSLAVYQHYLGWDFVQIGGIIPLFTANKSGLFRFSFFDFADGSSGKYIMKGANQANYSSSYAMFNYGFLTKIPKRKPGYASDRIPPEVIKATAPIAFGSNSDYCVFPTQVQVGQFFVQKDQKIFFGIVGASLQGGSYGIKHGDGEEAFNKGEYLKFTEYDIY